ncbi:unnamed protein product, partial [Amoebophrya sp. A120]
VRECGARFASRRRPVFAVTESPALAALFLNQSSHCGAQGSEEGGRTCVWW